MLTGVMIGLSAPTGPIRESIVGAGSAGRATGAQASRTIPLRCSNDSSACRELVTVRRRSCKPPRKVYLANRHHARVLQGEEDGERGARLEQRAALTEENPTLS